DVKKAGASTTRSTTPTLTTTTGCATRWSPGTEPRRGGRAQPASRIEIRDHVPELQPPLRYPGRAPPSVRAAGTAPHLEALPAGLVGHPRRLRGGLSGRDAPAGPEDLGDPGTAGSPPEGRPLRAGRRARGVVADPRDRVRPRQRAPHPLQHDGPRLPGDAAREAAGDGALHHGVAGDR